MAAKVFGRNELAALGWGPQSTPGAIETTTPLKALLQNGVTLSYEDNIEPDEAVGFAGRIGADSTMKYLTFSAGIHQRFGDDREVVFAYLREPAVPSPLSVVLLATEATIALGATGKNGETVTQLQAPLGSLAGLISYNGATATTHPNGGAELYAADISGFTNPENNSWLSAAGKRVGHRRILNVWTDGATNDYIDFDPLYTSDGSAQFPAMSAETNTGSVTISVGIAGRVRLSCEGLVENYSALIESCSNKVNGRYLGIADVTVNDLAGPNFTGTGSVTLTPTFVGCTPQGLSDTNPTTNPIDKTGLLLSTKHMAGRDLKMLAVHRLTTQDNLVVSGLNVTGFSHTATGNVAAVTDVAGTVTPPGVSVGRQAGEISITYRHLDDPIVEKLSAATAPGTAEKVSVDLYFRDPDDNQILWGFPKGEPAYSGPTFGAGEGDTTGTLNITPYLATTSGSWMIYQEFPAA